MAASSTFPKTWHKTTFVRSFDKRRKAFAAFTLYTAWALGPACYLPDGWRIDAPDGSRTSLPRLHAFSERWPHTHPPPPTYPPPGEPRTGGYTIPPAHLPATMLLDGRDIYDTFLRLDGP